MFRKRNRVRINLTVDQELYELVQKWSYVCGLPASRLFDLVMAEHVLRFRYRNEEDWLASPEYRLLETGIDELPLPPDTERPPAFSAADLTAADLAAAGIPRKKIKKIFKKSQSGDIRGLLRSTLGDKEVIRILARRLRGPEYYARWQEVGGQAAAP